MPNNASLLSISPAVLEVLADCSGSLIRILIVPNSADVVMAVIRAYDYGICKSIQKFSVS